MEVKPALQAAPSSTGPIFSVVDKQKSFREYFEETMPSSRKPIKHETAAVLLLSYEYPEMTGMDTRDELQRFGRVFEEDYGFHVEKKTFNSLQKVQLQITCHLSNFVMAHDKSHALLIIYYAGHAWRSSDEERKKWGGYNLNPGGPRYQREYTQDQIVMWEVSERILFEARGDILVIFDCCDTGALQNVRSDGRSFEYLGACGPLSTTRLPGEDSFTSALIWALKELRDTPSFTTTELCAKLRSHPKFPKEQQPYLSHRRNYIEEPIWISSLKKPSPSGAGIKRRRSDPESEYREEKCGYVDFRVAFGRPLAEEDGVNVANMMKPLVTGRDLPLNARCVSFLRKGICEPKPLLARARWSRAQNHVLAARRFQRFQKRTVDSGLGPCKKLKLDLSQSKSEELNLKVESGSSTALDVEHVTELPMTPTSGESMAGNDQPAKIRIDTSFGQAHIPPSFMSTFSPGSSSSVEDLFRDVERLKQFTLQRPEMLDALHSQVRVMLESVAQVLPEEDVELHG